MIANNKTINILLIIIMAGLLMADRFLKFWARHELVGKDYLIFSEHGGLGFKFFANSGIAFSLPLHGQWLMAILSVVFIWLIYLLIQNWRCRNYCLVLVLVLIIAGALSNVIDRLLFGYVVDFINIFWWPAFNLADAMIVVGVILWIWLGWRKAD